MECSPRREEAGHQVAPVSKEGGVFQEKDGPEQNGEPDYQPPLGGKQNGTPRESLGKRCPQGEPV